MNITSLNYTIKLFGRIFNEKNATVPFLNGIERKYRSKNIAIEQPFDVALPEEENVPSENIRRFLEIMVFHKNHYMVIVIMMNRKTC